MNAGRAVICALLIIAVAGLAGCATPTAYQPANGGEGYSDQQIEAQRFRVTFSGNNVTPRATVENYLLYRAAQITVDRGYQLFTIVEHSNEPETNYVTSFNSGADFGYFYRPFGFGLSTGTSTPVTSYHASIVIVLSKGQKPANALHTYDAQQVMQNLGPHIHYPGP